MGVPQAAQAAAADVLVEAAAEPQLRNRPVVGWPAAESGPKTGSAPSYWEALLVLTTSNPDMFLPL